VQYRVYCEEFLFALSDLGKAQPPGPPKEN
jgi:hypothetical protein